MFYRLANVTMRALLGALARMEVVGRENVPASGPFILVANHTHFVDPPLLACQLQRKVIYMAKEEVFRTPVLSWIVRGYEAFPVRRGQPDRAALKRADRVLREGLGLGMFPEGTRSRDGVLREAHPGVALIALRSGAPVIPVGIDGSDRLLPAAFLLRRPCVRISIGPPLPTLDQSDRPDLAALTEEMMRAVARQLPPHRRGTYADSAARAVSPLPGGGAVVGKLGEG